MNDLKERFKEIRNSLGLNQEFIGNKMNRSQSAYGKLETGVTDISYSDLLLFASAVEMSVIDVLTWPEKWVPDTNKKYSQNSTIDITEENYSTCKKCIEKDQRITDLRENLKDLRTQLEYFQALYRKTGSG